MAIEAQRGRQGRDWGSATLPEMAEPRYRYQITRNGQRVGWIEAEWRGPAEWQLEDASFQGPRQPSTMDALDRALYAAGYEVMPEE
jgi:hypothetical protein